MAARRLIIVMLVLLGISTAIAIVVPEPREPDSQEETAASGETDTTGATGSTGSDGDSGGIVDRSSGSEMVETKVEPGRNPAPVRAAAGDRLVLTVKTAQPATVEILDLGLTQTTSEYAPAVFDVILPDEPKTIRVTELESGRTLAVIETGA